MEIWVPHIHSSTLVEFCQVHPVNQHHANKHDASLKGLGNIMAPVPLAETFFKTLYELKSLFTQQEYFDHVMNEPGNLADPAWMKTIGNPRVREAFRVRVDRNFYVSFVDSLHVWALICENSDQFDLCYIDITEDYVSKIDIKLHMKGGRIIPIALKTATHNGRQTNDYKDRKRGTSPSGTVDIWMNMDFALLHGKRWHTWPELRSIFRYKTGLAF